MVHYTFFAKRTPQLQERNEARWRPGQEACLAPPCLNLKFFGSKCTALKKVLVTLLGLFGAFMMIWRPGNCTSLALSLLLPCQACNCFRAMTNNNFGTTSVATQQLLTDCPDRLTRFRVQYRPSRQMEIEHLLLVVEWPTFGAFGLNRRFTLRLRV